MRTPTLSLLFVVACAHAPPPSAAPAGPPVELVAFVDAARVEVRALLAEQAEMAWKNWVLGDSLDLAKTYQGRDQLFTNATLQRVRALEALTTDPRTRRALTFFRVYLTGEIVALSTADIAGQVAALEADATFQGPDGAEHPYRELDRLAAAERDHRKRLALYDATSLVSDKLQPLRSAWDARVRAELQKLGPWTEEAFALELREADRTGLAVAADALLTQTETLYRLAADHAFRASLGLSLDDARRADVSSFARAPDLDAAFAPDKMMPRLRETLLGLGIDLAHQPQIRVDDAPLPSKNPRAACFDVTVPDDIRLSLRPVGGLSDYRALFHEAGHAEHYANTTISVFELQVLGDRTVGEAYAQLFEGLVVNPLWLADHVDLAAAKRDDLVRDAAIKRLLWLRRDAGKLLVELASGDAIQSKSELYRAIMARAYGFPVSAEDARRDAVWNDDYLGAADSFRAPLLRAQLEERLVQEGGARWWMSAKAGAFLRSLWAEGNALTVDEVAKRLGTNGLELGPYLRELDAVLKSSK